MVANTTSYYSFGNQNQTRTYIITPTFSNQQRDMSNNGINNASNLVHPQLSRSKSLNDISMADSINNDNNKNKTSVFQHNNLLANRNNEFNDSSSSSYNNEAIMHPEAQQYNPSKTILPANVSQWSRCTTNPFEFSMYNTMAITDQISNLRL